MFEKIVIALLTLKDLVLDMLTLGLWSKWEGDESSRIAAVHWDDDEDRSL